MNNKNIIFFDSQCKLCDRFVNFIFKKDSKKYFYYAPLQGKTAQKILNKKDIKTLKSIIVCHKQLIFKETQAIQTIMKPLYPRWSFLFSILPMSFFTIFYRFIAKYRYTLFGKKTLYQVSEEQKNYFLP